MRDPAPRFNLPEGKILTTQVPIPLDAEIFLKPVGDVTAADIRPLAQYHLGQGTMFEIAYWDIILPAEGPPYIDLMYILVPPKPTES